jgi:hypothetical protein
LAPGPDEALPASARGLCIAWQVARDHPQVPVLLQSVSPLLSGGRDPRTVDLLCSDLLASTR